MANPLQERELDIKEYCHLLTERRNSSGDDNQNDEAISTGWSIKHGWLGQHQRCGALLPDDSPIIDPETNQGHYSAEGNLLNGRRFAEAVKPFLR